VRTRACAHNRKVQQAAPASLHRAASSDWSQLKTADPKCEVEAFLTLY
jgi:hypothetical protein